MLPSVSPSVFFLRFNTWYFFITVIVNHPSFLNTRQIIESGVSSRCGVGYTFLIVCVLVLILSLTPPRTTSRRVKSICCMLQRGFCAASLRLPRTWQAQFKCTLLGFKVSIASESDAAKNLHAMCKNHFILLDSTQYLSASCRVLLLDAEIRRGKKKCLGKIFPWMHYWVEIKVGRRHETWPADQQKCRLWPLNSAALQHAVPQIIYIFSCNSICCILSLYLSMFSFLTPHI